MIRILFASFLFAAPAIAADDLILVDLAKAKLAHAKDMARIRQELLDDIDRVIRKTNDMGGGIDYMLRERKGFVENGTIPILPKLKVCSGNYLEAKAAYDLTLESAYASAIERSVKGGKLDQSSDLKAQLRKLRDARQGFSEPPAEIRMPAPKTPAKEHVLSRAAERDPMPGDVREFEIARGMRMKFCWIPAGKATLGSPANEKERVANESEHTFETKGFWLGKYEVTQGDWESLMASNPSHIKGVNLPVENVSWNDCQEFIKNCRVDGLIVRLPHEDEWEYACRGGKGNKQPFYMGNELKAEQVNFLGKQTTIVGSFEKTAPHPWGLCDMHGNVWEWCENIFSESGVNRTLRGGGWDSVPGLCRSAWRSHEVPQIKNLNLGFRLALASTASPVAKNETIAPKSVAKSAPTPMGKSAPIETKPVQTPGATLNSKNLPPEPLPDSLVKDEKVEKEFNRAKFNFNASSKTATAALMDSYEQARLNVAATKNLTDAAKLASLEALAKDREAFEKEGASPRHPAIQLAAKRFKEAMNKARVEFSKTVNEAAKIYVDRKDLANYEALLKEKQRFLEYPTAIDILALLGGPNDKLEGEYSLKNGILNGRFLIELPYEPGREYDLHVTIERLTGDDLITLGVVAGDYSCYMLFDGWAAAGHRSGLQYIDGKLAIHNGTQKIERTIPPKTQVQIDMSVRKDSIRTWVQKRDDKERRLILEYTGPQDKLSLGDFAVKNKKGLFLYSNNSMMAVSKFDLVPIGSDKGKPTR